MAVVQSQYESSAAELELEKFRRNEAEERAKTLDVELRDAWAQVESKVEDVQKERVEIEALKAEMESVKRQYYLVSDKVEEEQNRVMEAQRTTQQLSEQVLELLLSFATWLRVVAE